MIRAAIVIVAMAAIATGLVHLRRLEARTRYQLHQNLDTQTRLRRDLWDKRVHIGSLVAPNQVKRRSDSMALDLTTLFKVVVLTNM